MAQTRVVIDCRKITDSESFHEVFASTFGFPEFYGRTMDAWIDCFAHLDDPLDTMTTVHAPKGGMLVIHLKHVEDFAGRCPELYNDLLECAAFVNCRRILEGYDQVLSLTFH